MDTIILIFIWAMTWLCTVTFIGLAFLHETLGVNTFFAGAISGPLGFFVANFVHYAITRGDHDAHA